MYSTQDFVTRNSERMKNRLSIITKERDKLQNNLIISATLNMLLVILVGIGILIFIGNISMHNIKIAGYKTEIANLESELSSLSEEFNTTTQLLADVSEIAVSLDEDNMTLKEDNLSLQEELNIYKDREELYNKYEYALYREDGTRTDISYDNLKTLEEQTKEKGMTEEANDLILAIAMTESKGTESAKNINSSASGYGQFLSSTGKFVYTELLGNETYNHSVDALDGNKNITMMVAYIDYLGEKYNGNIIAVMDEYRGIHDDTYLVKIDNYLSKKDLQLSSIKIKE